MYRYCPQCGSRLILVERRGRARAYCSPCDAIHYQRLKVGAGALIEREGKLLLLRRAIDPFRGCWNLPAGYVEVDEHPAQAAIRETREETGLLVGANDLVEVYFLDDDPRGNGLIIVYRCHVIGGDLEAGDESLAAGWFAPHALPQELAGGGHDRTVRAWARQASST